MWDLTVPGDHDFYIDSVAAPVLVCNCPLTESAARRAAFRTYNVPTSQANNYERVNVWGDNMNLRGPNGEPGQILRTTDVNGNPVEIQNHMWVTTLRTLGGPWVPIT
jgi:hypothetical protein